MSLETASPGPSVKRPLGWPVSRLLTGYKRNTSFSKFELATILLGDNNIFSKNLHVWYSTKLTRLSWAFRGKVLDTVELRHK